jgi:hypothetical protein
MAMAGDTAGLDYISAQLRELTKLARRDGWEMLAYLIDMAHLEAEEQRQPKFKLSSDP